MFAITRFDSEYEDEILCKIKQGKYNFDKEIWQKVSPEAKDL